MIRFVNWIFRTFAPYAAGIAVGVGFFFLLTRYAPFPVLSPSPSPSTQIDKQTLLPQRDSDKSIPRIEAPVKPAPSPSLVVAPKVPVTPPAPVIPQPATTTVIPQPATTTVIPQPATTTVIHQPATTTLIPQPATTTVISQPATTTVIPQPTTTTPSPLVNPPAQPNREWSQAKQWQKDCLERLAWAKRMVEDGLSRCPPTGYMRQNCLDYYRGLEQRYQGVTCDPNTARW